VLFVEFIAPVKKSTQANKCLCALYYLKHNLQIEVASIAQIRNLLHRGRVVSRGNINYTRALGSLAEKVDSPANGLWQITPSGERVIRDLLGLTEGEMETENDTTLLERLIDKKVVDDEVKEYFREGVDCLKIGRLRATVVFLWAGSIYLIRKALISQNLPKLNMAIQKYDSKAREVKTIDDFAYIKDVTQLLAMKELGLCDKAQKDVLDQCLDLRNKCGHPTKYSPGPKRVSAFIEDLVNVILP